LRDAVKKQSVVKTVSKTQLGRFSKEVDSKDQGGEGWSIGTGKEMRVSRKKHDH